MQGTRVDSFFFIFLSSSCFMHSHDKPGESKRTTKVFDGEYVCFVKKIEWKELLINNFMPSYCILVIKNLYFWSPQIKCLIRCFSVAEYSIESKWNDGWKEMAKFQLQNFPMWKNAGLSIYPPRIQPHILMLFARCDLYIRQSSTQRNTMLSIFPRVCRCFFLLLLFLSTPRCHCACADLVVQSWLLFRCVIFQ